VRGRTGLDWPHAACHRRATAACRWRTLTATHAQPIPPLTWITAGSIRYRDFLLSSRSDAIRAMHGPDGAMMGGRSRSTRDRRPFVACIDVMARRSRLTSTDLLRWWSAAIDWGRGWPNRFIPGPPVGPSNQVSNYRRRSEEAES